MTKTCTKCVTAKPLTEFYTRTRRGKVTAQNWCKSCQSDYYREKVAQSPRYFLDMQLASRRGKRDRVIALRSERGCADCGEKHPACLEFHHSDREEKVTTVSQLVTSNAGWPRIEEEMAKCIVLCSNCHRKRHWTDHAALRATHDAEQALTA